MKNVFETPITNRGVDTPIDPDFWEKLEYYFLVDWMQFTIFNCEMNPISLFIDLFHVNRDDISISESGLFSYNMTYYYKNIKLFTNTYRDDMGYHFMLSGQGCRDFEDLGIGYDSFFKKLISLGAKFTRLDLSIDSFTDKYFTIEKVVDCIRNNEVHSKFRHSVEYNKTNLTTNLNDGYTIWFGSRSSNIQIVFYDKKKERLSNDVLVSEKVKLWNRLECRFRHEYCDIIINNYVNCDDFVKYFFGVLNNYLSFVIYNPDDLKHRYRWKVYDWWYNFLGLSDKVKLCNINVEKSITRIDNWISHSVSRSLFMLFVANYQGEFNSFDNYIKYLKNGFVKICPNDLVFINDYRRSRNLAELSIDDLGDIIKEI